MTVEMKVSLEFELSTWRTTLRFYSFYSDALLCDSLLQQLSEHRDSRLKAEDVQRFRFQAENHSVAQQNSYL